jgi:hypothetical protein
VQIFVTKKDGTKELLTAISFSADFSRHVRSVLSTPRR